MSPSASLTQRVGNITAFCAAVCGLVILLLTNYDQIHDKCVELDWCSPRRCVEFREVKLPEVVAYDEWDGQRIHVVGQTNCPAPGGFYMTFDARPTAELFANVRPLGDDRECFGDSARYTPACWDIRKPISNEEGTWVWPVLLPPLERLRSPRPVEVLHLRWEIRDYDAPDQSVIAADLAEIEIRAVTGSS